MESRTLRTRRHINYHEPEEPPRDAYEYCDKCDESYYNYCAIHGGLLVVPDDRVKAQLESAETPRAMLSAPAEFLYIDTSSIPDAGLGVFAKRTLPQGVRFGPYRGQRTQNASTSYCWQIMSEIGRASHVIDGSDASRPNWLRYVNCARHSSEQNLVAYQFHGQIYYRTTKIIRRGHELLVFYGTEFAMKLNIHLGKYNSKLKNTKPGEQSTKSSGSETQDATPINLVDALNSSPAELRKVNANIMGLINLDKYCKGELINGPGNSGIDIYSIFDSADACTAQSKETNSDPYIEEASMGENVTVNDKLEPNCRVPDSDDQEPIVVNTQDHEQRTDIADGDEKDLRNTESMNLSQTENASTTKSLWKCNVCNQVMPSRDQLRGHRRIHIGKQKFNCSMCTYQTDLEAYYKRHEQSHIKTKGSQEKKTKSAKTHKLSWECENCQKVFSSRADLRNHKRIHGGSYKFKCNSCNYQTDVKYYIERHLKATHKISELLKCGRCNFTSRNARVFMVHEGLHENKKAIKCEMCDYLCPSTRYLHAHLLRVHVSTKLHQCAVCASAFNCVEYLRKHIKNVHISRDK